VTSPLLIVDGDSLMHRAYHAMPPVAGAGGRPVNALLGFANMLFTIYDATSPRAIAVALDSREPGYHSELFPPYQGQRDAFDAAIVEQLDALPAFLAQFGIPAPRVRGFEADDVLATLALREEERGGDALVLTSDRDAYQVVSAHVHVLRPAKGVAELERVDSQGVVERYGVLPCQVPDLIALRGDPSDNLPGARGIGAKTAAALLLRHGDLEGVLAHAASLAPARRAALEEHGDELRRFLQVATMRRDLDVDVPPDHVPDWRAGAAEARRRGLDGLAGRLEARADA
jgi:DNA polymerase-1